MDWALSKRDNEQAQGRKAEVSETGSLPGELPCMCSASRKPEKASSLSYLEVVMG